MSVSSLVPCDAMSEPELTNDYEVYTPDWDDAYAFDIEFEEGVNIDLIEELGMEDMRPRLWRVEPGEKLSYHYHEEQEELFYVESGTAEFEVGRERDIEIVDAGLNGVPLGFGRGLDDELYLLSTDQPRGTGGSGAVHRVRPAE